MSSNFIQWIAYYYRQKTHDMEPYRYDSTQHRWFMQCFFSHPHIKIVSNYMQLCDKARLRVGTILSYSLFKHSFYTFKTTSSFLRPGLRIRNFIWRSDPDPQPYSSSKPKNSKKKSIKHPAVKQQIVNTAQPPTPTTTMECSRGDQRQSKLVP